MKLIVLHIWKTISIFCASCVLFMFTATGLAQGTAKNSGGEVRFESEVLDYGRIQLNSDGARTFTFTNTGSAPVVVTGVKSGCGCTVPGYTNEPVMPGGKGVIEVTYDTSRPGAFHKSIIVTTNTQPRGKRLYIQGEVLASSASQVN